jgi:hypothetical protein
MGSLLSGHRTWTANQAFLSRCLILDAAVHASHDVLSKDFPNLPSALIDVHRARFIATHNAVAQTLRYIVVQGETLRIRA